MLGAEVLGFWFRVRGSGSRFRSSWFARASLGSVGSVRKREHFSKFAPTQKLFVFRVQELVASLAERCSRIVEKPVKLAGVEAVEAFCDQIRARPRRSPYVVAEFTIGGGGEGGRKCKDFPLQVPAQLPNIEVFRSSQSSHDGPQCTGVATISEPRRDWPSVRPCPAKAGRYVL